jgi:hypothetical protein
VGFDALDLHRYLLTLGYETGLQTPEGLFQYSNRAWGAVLTGTISSSVQGITELSYQRKDSFGIAASLYRPFTESVLNPSLEWSWERVRFHSRLSDRVSGSLLANPTLRARVDYSDTDASRQAIAPEEGWSTTLGHQWTYRHGVNHADHELLWTQGHYFNLGGHRVIWPHWQLLSSGSGSVQVEGRRNLLVESFSRPDFDQLVVRGYPLTVYSGLKHAAGTTQDFRRPQHRVERGWGTYPVFLEVVHALAFAEQGWLMVPGSEVYRLPAFGAGIRADWQVLTVVPLVTCLEYHQGTNVALGGKSELFFEFRLGSFSF